MINNCIAMIIMTTRFTSRRRNFRWKFLWHNYFISKKRSKNNLWAETLREKDDARSEGGSVHENVQNKKWEKILELFVLKRESRKGVLKFINILLEKLKLSDTNIQLWKRPLHDFFPLFFCRKKTTHLPTVRHICGDFRF